jgi:hypothetical protein
MLGVNVRRKLDILKVTEEKKNIEETAPDD